ncbi:hypothetical protein HPB52_004918 [Rhipicephalus sanguineus]|uniref:Uncharacterized protein n=1 Tax=Rhipicephalus sanguineus TaxID=34632 RepID=A0A9D4PH13_RHISA|nr:hypothetical protein HPB52_004918 [Rhipicephalus sanguineus]
MTPQGALRAFGMSPSALACLFVVLCCGAVDRPLCYYDHNCDALGTHNTLSELLEAQWTSQRQRLLLTPTGRHLLSRLGYPFLPNDVEDTTIALPPWVRRTLKVHPLPRNMSPEHDAGRRRARVRYLVRMLGDIPETNTLYTDAARCCNGYSAVVLDGGETLLTAASLRSATPTDGEVLGVALAVQQALQIPGELVGGAPLPSMRTARSATTRIIR